MQILSHVEGDWVGHRDPPIPHVGEVHRGCKTCFAKKSPRVYSPRRYHGLMPCCGLLPMRICSWLRHTDRLLGWATSTHLLNSVRLVDIIVLCEGNKSKVSQMVVLPSSLISFRLKRVGSKSVVVMAQTWGEKGEEREGEDAHGFILSPKMISL